MIDDAPVRVMAVGTVMVDVLAVGLPGIAEPGHVVYAPKGVQSRIGGHAVDVAIDLVALGHPPDAVALVAGVGTGMHASFADAEIARHGFQTLVQRFDTCDTGTNLVLEVEGEDRRFHIDPGANWLLDPGHVLEAARQFDPQVLTVRPGYTGIDHQLPDVLAPFRNTLVLLDVMQPHPARPPDLVVEALEHVDVVHCNEHEALLATGARDLDDAVDVLLDGGAGLVLLTSGGGGAHAVTPRDWVTQRGYRVDVVDATGCGDAFCAGAIAWLAATASPPTRETVDGLDADDLALLLAHAQAIGASAATAVGCVEGVSRRRVDELRAGQTTRVLSQTRATSRA